MIPIFLIFVILFSIIYSTVYTNPVGVHYLINIENIDVICNKKVSTICEKLIERTNLHVLNKGEHRFEPEGYTCFYLLSESHLSAHTWPEHNKVCMDFFSCSSNKLDQSYTKNTILQMFPNSSVKISSIIR
jgi:S-adenosylmethionine/arginine decarboxylase-like enzyme